MTTTVKRQDVVYVWKVAQAKCKNIVQVLCHLVEGENNFTFEFLGVKVQESKKEKNLKKIHLRI